MTPCSVRCGAMRCDSVRCGAMRCGATHQAGLRHAGSHFTLEMPFGPPFSSVWVEDLTVKVRSREGKGALVYAGRRFCDVIILTLVLLGRPLPREFSRRLLVCWWLVLAHVRKGMCYIRCWISRAVCSPFERVVIGAVVVVAGVGQVGARKLLGSRRVTPPVSVCRWVRLSARLQLWLAGYPPRGCAQRRRASSVRGSFGGAHGALHVPRRDRLWQTCGDLEDEERRQGTQRNVEGAKNAKARGRHPAGRSFSSFAAHA